MTRALARDIVIPDSELTRHVSPLLSTPPAPLVASRQLAMDAKPKVRVTYGRKPVFDDTSPLVEDSDALPPSSAPEPPFAAHRTRSVSDIKDARETPFIEKAGPLDTNADGDLFADEDVEGADTAPFAYDWQRQLAQMDDSDDDNQPVNDENVPPPKDPKPARVPLGPLFSGSTPPLTSSSPSNRPVRPLPKRLSLDSKASQSGSSPDDHAMLRRTPTKDDESSPLSEDPSKLFGSPIFLQGEISQGGISPDSSLARRAVTRSPTWKAKRSLLVVPDDDDDLSVGGAAPSRRASASPHTSLKAHVTADKSQNLKDKLNQHVHERERSGSTYYVHDDVDDMESVEKEREAMRSTSAKGRKTRRRQSDAASKEEERSKKKTKKLSKKELEESSRETARLLAMQEASIPRHENRLTLSSLFNTIHMSTATIQVNAVSTAEQVQQPGYSALLRKLPRPSLTHNTQTWAPSDDPIVDASSPFISAAQVSGGSLPIPSSLLAQSSQATVAENSTPLVGKEILVKAPAVLEDDSDDELPDADELLEADQCRRDQEAEKAKLEMRRQAKKRIIDQRIKNHAVPASSLLHSNEDDGTDLEIDGENEDLHRASKKNKEQQGNRFLAKLVSSMPGHSSKTALPPLLPTDSQLDRAARPSFDLSSPPSTRKKGRDKKAVNKDSLNRKLLNRAGAIAEQEIKKKEEEWLKRGGKRREVGDVEVDMNEVLRKAAEETVVNDEQTDRDDDEDGDWKPDGTQSGGEEGSASPGHGEEAEDADVEMNAPLSPLRYESVSPPRSPSLSDDDKENEEGQNKENEAPKPRVRAVLGEMQIERALTDSPSDSDEEAPWQPRKRRRLTHGLMAVVDDEEQEQIVDSRPVARKLFQDTDNTAEEDDDGPKEITGLGAPFDGLSDDPFSSASGAFGAGGLSQFFVESQVATEHLSAMRDSAFEKLQTFSPARLMPSIKLSTQQKLLEDEVFAEDQENRLQDALRSAREQAEHEEWSRRGDRLSIPEAFIVDDFTQRENPESIGDFLFDFGENRENDDAPMDVDVHSSLDLDLGPEDNEPLSPSQRPLTRLRRQASTEFDRNDDDTELPGAITVPSAPLAPSSAVKQRSAFEVMQQVAARKERAKTKKQFRTEFVHDAAEESEEEGMLGFGAGRIEEEEDDTDADDAVLKELVDDQAMHENTLAADKVREKALEHQAEDDAAIEKYHMDAVQGKRRMRRRGDEFFDDDEDEDVRRQYRPAGPQRRKDGAEELEALGKNPETLPHLRAYQATFMPYQENEFDYLQPPEVSLQDAVEQEAEEEEDADEELDDEGGSDKEPEPTARVVSHAQLQKELRQAALNKESMAPPMNVNDVSWVDKEDPDEDVDRGYRPIKSLRKPKALVQTGIEDMMLGGRSRDLDPKEKAKLQKYAKEDSYNLNTNRGGGTVTGYVQAKPGLKQTSSASKGKGTQAVPSNRTSVVGQSFFDRKGGFLK